MKCSTCCVFILISTLLLTGCKKEDPNPELLDPIFKDLDARAAGYQKSLDEELKKQVELRVALDKAEPNSIDLKNARRDLEKSTKAALDFDQKARYYVIRAKRRLLTDRIAYKLAFSKGEAWPDSHEYSDYQVNMRLQEAPRNWNVRVPKLKDRLPSSVGKAEKSKEKTEKVEE